MIVIDIDQAKLGKRLEPDLNLRVTGLHRKSSRLTQISRERNRSAKGSGVFLRYVRPLFT